MNLNDLKNKVIINNEIDQKNLVPVKLGKKNIMIAGIKKPVMISTLIIIFCMSVPPKTNKPHLLAGRYF